MKLMFMLFGVGALLEALLYGLPSLWSIRKALLPAATLASTVGAAGICWYMPNVLSALLVIGCLYRVFNVYRLFKARMHEGYLRRATRRTSLVLISVQGAIGGIWWAWYQTPAHRQTAWLIVAVLQMVVAGVLLASTVRRIRRTHPDLSGAPTYSDAALPSITVAIPARNETQDLEECLESIVASDYPKLEIIVLDDCSQNKRTPEIIRSFAHDGVRFIQGEEPRATWLAKNQAYDRLTAEASGQYILFCGVDIRFAPDSIRKLVGTMLSRRKAMMSILPRFVQPDHTPVPVLQAMRYWWELVPPRRLFGRPPVLSSCWIIERQSLQKIGGFAAVTRAIVPEAYFAKALLQGDRYSFMRSNTVLGVDSSKQATDQYDTAIRMRYPQLHRRPEQVVMATLLEALFLVLPFVMAVGGWWLPITGITQVFAALASGCLIVSYLCMAAAARLGHRLYGLIALPIMALADIVTMHRSMWQYEFSEVVWKDRNVCIPVMHVTPHLPKLDP